jgi:hypothetical protein
MCDLLGLHGPGRHGDVRDPRGRSGRRSSGGTEGGDGAVPLDPLLGRHLVGARPPRARYARGPGQQADRSILARSSVRLPRGSGYRLST